VSEPPPPIEPGERRLDRPPSDRYADPITTGTEGTDPSGGTADARRARARSLIAGLIVGFLGAVAIVLLGGVLSVSAGLLVVAMIIGWGTGRAVLGAADPTDRGRSSRTRSVFASFLAIDAVILGQLGLWLYAGSEGGVLSLPDYLLQTFGPLVPLQIVLAAGAAWLTAR
jgi:hypothetical protein